MKTAIITGASSGIGEEFVSAVLDEFPDIDCLWLIARNKERLEEIAKEIEGKTVACISLDLTTDKAISDLEAILAKEKPEVELLINNAGIGRLGNIADESLDSQSEMIDLNCKAMASVTRLVLPYMGEGSHIVLTSSIASFAPTPRMTVYSATKAFVSFYARGLHEELKPRSISCTAVCPPPMNTAFLDRANITGNSKAFEALPHADPAEVAISALKAAKAGKAVYTPKALYKFYRVLAAIVPHSIIVKFSKV